jgi:hypothetical protein
VVGEGVVTTHEQAELILEAAKRDNADRGPKLGERFIRVDIGS